LVKHTYLLTNKITFYCLQIIKIIKKTKMADKKSILEEALLDIKNIENALNANTKEILRSVAREEIDSVVKESLDEVYEEEEVNSMNEESHEEHEKSETPAEEKKEHGKGGSEKKEKAESKKMTEGEMETKGMEAEGMTYEEGMDDLGASEELDMTSASDDDVIAIYKKLTGDDEIEIVGDEIHLNISQPGEYVVKKSSIGMGSSVAPSMDSEMEPEMDSDMDSDMELEMEPEMGGESDVDYEIEMGDDEEGEEPTDLVPVEDEEGESSEFEAGEEEEEIDELEEGARANAAAVRKAGAEHQPIGPGGKQEAKFLNINESARVITETKKKYNNLLTEAKKLKAENDEFRGALKEFRTKLVETVVFNSNLTYVTRLFMEHSTTKSEKQNIIKKFDEEVSSLKESKKLYKTIANELENRKPINESLDKKIIKEVNTSSSKQLNENTAYVDPSTKRILDLIQRVERK
jgi:hypothetical protein